MAVADPVLVGINDRLLARARRRSLCGASTTTWVLVMSWIVVITPCSMPIDSWITLTTGAKQLVVHEAAVSRRCFAGSYKWSFTPMTMFRAPDFTGAATITFVTPVEKYGSSVSVVRNYPKHSSTISTRPTDPGTSPSFDELVNTIYWPRTESP